MEFPNMSVVSGSNVMYIYAFQVCVIDLPLNEKENASSCSSLLMDLDTCDSSHSVCTSGMSQHLSPEGRMETQRAPGSTQRPLSAFDVRRGRLYLSLKLEIK